MTGHPTIHDAERLARRDEKDIVIILHVTRDGVCGYASYGRDKALRRKLARLVNACVPIKQYRDDVFCGRTGARIPEDAVDSILNALDACADENTSQREANNG